VRTSRGALSIWEHATGDELVYGLDLMRDLSNARFLADGRLEINGRQPGVLDLPRNASPAALIAADIACRVPLRVVGSRVEPAAPTCP
jgi:hypothetical protein